VPSSSLFFSLYFILSVGTRAMPESLSSKWLQRGRVPVYKLCLSALLMPGRGGGWEAQIWSHPWAQFPTLLPEPVYKSLDLKPLFPSTVT
jgi:hypothetical protein